MEALCLSWYDLGMVNSRWLTELVLLSEAHGDTKYLLYVCPSGNTLQRKHMAVIWRDLSEHSCLCPIPKSIDGDLAGVT